MNINSTLGKFGEDLATTFLIDKGYLIRHKNYTCQWGELDIVCEKDKRIIFIEVKTRISTKQGAPHESLTKMKNRHLMRSMRYYIRQFRLNDWKLALDVVSITLNRDKSIKELKHYENLDVSKF